MTVMRRAIAFALLFIAGALTAQTIRVGPEHVIPPATGNGAVGQMLGVFPHGDAVVAFSIRNGLHETLLDRSGNLLSETRTADIDEAEVPGTLIAQAGDGYLVVQGRSTGKTVAARLDFNFQVRGKIVELASNARPLSVACGDAACAVAIALYDGTDQYTMLLGLDGTVINPRLSPSIAFDGLVATTHGFLGAYTDAAHVFHTLFFDANGVTGHRSDYGTLREWWTKPGMTAVSDGAIVVWPQDETLNATRVGSDGAIVDTHAIATFDYLDFGDIAVACSGAECTAGVEWYYDSYSVIEGAFWPVHQIHAVRFTTSLTPIDPKPVLISKTSDNFDLRIVITPAGSILGWTAFSGRVPRIAILGRGTTPYAGDINLPGVPFNFGWVTVGEVAASPGALAWTDYAADGQRSVRWLRIDDEGVPIDTAPAVLERDYSDGYFSGHASDGVAVGSAGGSYVVAWQSTFANVMFARSGESATTIPGQLAMPMVTDGRESVLVVSKYPSDAHDILRFGSASTPVMSEMNVHAPRGGALSNGTLFIQGDTTTEFVDFNNNRRVSNPAPLAIYAAAFAFGEHSVRSFFLGLDDQRNAFAGVQHFTLDGRPLDSHLVALPQLIWKSFAIPLGTRFLHVWDSGPDAERGGTTYAAVVDPDTGVASPASVIADDGRMIVALVPRDASRAIAVFTKRLSNGDDNVLAVGTEMLQVESDLHHRATGH